jgi:hypothetical protein
MKKLVLSLGLAALLLFSNVRSVRANATPEVDVQTGMVTNGPLYVNQPFVWVNRIGTSCSVSDANGQQWFSPDPVTVPAASGGNTGTVTVTATAAGTFYYTSPCLEGGVVGGGSVKIHS